MTAADLLNIVPELVLFQIKPATTPSRRTWRCHLGLLPWTHFSLKEWRSRGWHLPSPIWGLGKGYVFKCVHLPVYQGHGSRVRRPGAAAVRQSLHHQEIQHPDSVMILGCFSGIVGAVVASTFCLRNSQWMLNDTRVCWRTTYWGSCSSMAAPTFSRMVQPSTLQSRSRPSWLSSPLRGWTGLPTAQI